jgi:hypothetical protein
MVEREGLRLGEEPLTTLWIMVRAMVDDGNSYKHQSEEENELDKLS